MNLPVTHYAFNSRKEQKHSLLFIYPSITITGPSSALDSWHHNAKLFILAQDFCYSHTNVPINQFFQKADESSFTTHRLPLRKRAPNMDIAPCKILQRNIESSPHFLARQL